MKCDFFTLGLVNNFATRHFCTRNIVELISNSYLFFTLLWKKLHNVRM